MYHICLSSCGFLTFQLFSSSSFYSWNKCSFILQWFYYSVCLIFLECLICLYVPSLSYYSFGVVLVWSSRSSTWSSWSEIFFNPPWYIIQIILPTEIFIWLVFLLQPFRWFCFDVSPCGLLLSTVSLLVHISAICLLHQELIFSFEHT